MKKTKMMAVLGLVFLSLGLMTACGKSEKAKQEPKIDLEKVAKKDAQIVLDTIYQGKTTNTNDVSSESWETIEKSLLSSLESKQEEYFTENGNLNDFYLVLDDSNYDATEIIKSYAKAYLKATANVEDIKIKSVEVNDDEAEITASIRPIASLSEANPIGQARSQAFGGLDNDTIIRQSQNKDVKSIQRLITLKLYSIYYGDMGETPPLAPKDKTITFILKKSGNHFVANIDTYKGLAKNSREEVYADDDDSVDEIEDTDNSDI